MMVHLTEIFDQQIDAATGKQSEASEARGQICFWLLAAISASILLC